MANNCEENKPEWIEKVRSEGAVPFSLDPNKCPNGWASPMGDVFKVRGPKYFSKKAKIPGGQYVLKPLGFDWLKGPAKVSNILNNPHHRIRKVLDKEFPPSGDKKPPFIWAFNLQVPSKENYSAVAYFVALGGPTQENSGSSSSCLIEQFLKGGDDLKKSRLKLIANIVKGPWIVKKAVGEQAICIIGRALACNYIVTDNFVEVDIDIGSSVVASTVVHLALGYVAALTVDLAFLLESQTESELPERILGGIRFSELNVGSAETVVQLTSSPSEVAFEQSSRAKRLWRSLGQGISSLLHPRGSPRANQASIKESDSVSTIAGSPLSNKAVDHDRTVKQADMSSN